MDTHLQDEKQRQIELPGRAGMLLSPVFVAQIEKFYAKPKRPSPNRHLKAERWHHMLLFRERR
ncbi:MAG TPA: hypothetical protein VJ910_11670 [Desulfuromonadales bacterium]|nr:hypothetical protein [Desulfuromonadales bacterium]